MSGASIYCTNDQVMWSGCFGNTAPFVIFISDYLNNSGAGTGMSDYGAMIGVLIYGSGFGGGQCFSGLSVYEPKEFDQQPGTHIFVAGSFYINNKNLPGCTDGEAIIIDTAVRQRLSSADRHRQQYDDQQRLQCS